MTETRPLYRKYLPEAKAEARRLRCEGMTHREISKQLGVGLGTACEWTRGLELNQEQRSVIYAKIAASSWTQERRAAASKDSKLRLAQYRMARQHTRYELLQRITDFYDKNGRIPMKREFNMYREYKREFGVWNKALRTAGFKTNPELFARKLKSRDGHACDSFTESVIDDWLLSRKIPHERNWRYSGTKMTANFLIGGNNIILEFFGLAGVQKRYDMIILKKRNFCANYGLTLVEIYPRDLFPENHLSEKISPYLPL